MRDIVAVVLTVGESGYCVDILVQEMLIGPGGEEQWITIFLSVPMARSASKFLVCGACSGTKIWSFVLTRWTPGGAASESIWFINVSARTFGFAASSV